MDKSRDELLKRNYDLGEEHFGILKKPKDRIKSPHKLDKKENYNPKMEDHQKMFELHSPKLDMKF